MKRQCLDTHKPIPEGGLIIECRRYIDYLSLDTEGSELEILKSVDLTKYTFGIIDVEHNYIEPRRTQIRELLESHGYEYIRANKFDDCYKHKSLN